MRSSSAIGQVYVRPPKQRREGDAADPDGRGEENVDEHQSPRQMRAPLQLAEPHLPEQHEEDAQTEREEPRRPLASRAEVAEAEQERAQEDADNRRMRIDDRLEPREPVDVLRLPAARMRSRRSRKRAADDH